MAAASTARKRAPKKKAPASPAANSAPELTAEELEELAAGLDSDDSPIGPDGEIRPVEIGRTGKAGPEMVHIFTTGFGTAEEEKFFIPRYPNPAVTLKFMREARNPRIGQWLAVENAMVTLLGRPALDALAECADASEEDIAKVWTVVLHVLLGAVKRLQESMGPR